MNMLAVTDLAVVTRVKLRDLATMPHDPGAIAAAKRGLSTRDYGIWTLLRDHLWEYGDLPADEPALARIAGVRLSTFSRMAPALAAHFDRTPGGAWTDRHLLRQRGYAE